MRYADLDDKILTYDNEQTDAINKNSTDIANQQEAINELINIFYPVGTIYESTNSTNPSEFMGGTWERYGNGRVTVGLDSTQVEFNQVGKTGGEKTHQLTVDELASHSHQLYSWSKATGTVKDAVPAALNRVLSNVFTPGDGSTQYGAGGVSSTGDNQPHNNLQPYIVVYRFVRTA